MSIITPSGLPTELTEITNGETLIEVYNPDTGQNEKTGVAALADYVLDTPREAGAEYQKATSASCPFPIVASAPDNDTIRCILNWDEIPKQGTGLDLITSSMVFYDYLNAYATLGSFTISSLVIVKKQLYFTINQVGIATNILKYRPLENHCSDLKFIITG